MVGKWTDSQPSRADVAELADALDSGSSSRKGVEVQVLSSAPHNLSVLFEGERFPDDSGQISAMRSKPSQGISRFAVASGVEAMERETGLEPVTSSLGSWHSTTELLPPSVKSPITSLIPSITTGLGLMQILQNNRRI